MSAPVNTAKVINHVTKRDPVIGNELLIKLAGGSHEQWAPSLKGYRAACVVQIVNQILKDDGQALASEGMKSEIWRLVSLHEKNRRDAWFNLQRVDAHYKNAFKSVEAIAEDLRAPKKMRKDATAWLELFKEPRTENGLLILKEFALELAGKTEQHKSQIMIENTE